MDTIGKKELVELLGSVLEKIGTRQERNGPMLR